MWVTHELSMIATGKAEIVGTDCRDNLLTDCMNSFQKDLTIEGCAQVLESASEITFLLLLISAGFSVNCFTILLNFSHISPHNQFDNFLHILSHIPLKFWVIRHTVQKN